MDNPFADYLAKLEAVEQAVKLVSLHTRECVKQTEKAANYTLLTAYHVKESLLSASLPKEILND